MNLQRAVRTAETLASSALARDVIDTVPWLTVGAPSAHATPADPRTAVAPEAVKRLNMAARAKPMPGGTMVGSMTNPGDTWWVVLLDGLVDGVMEARLPVWLCG